MVLSIEYKLTAYLKGGFQFVVWLVWLFISSVEVMLTDFREKGKWGQTERERERNTDQLPPIDILVGD